MKILVLGVNGFIGNALLQRILEKTDWKVWGMDLADDRVCAHLGNPRFTFLEGDIAINQEWIQYHVKKCDLVIPLVAIATPKAYLDDPLAVFQLVFEENLRVVRQAVAYDTRVVFPSTSEVYGMCPDAAFSEEHSLLVLGPIRRQRWIYACAKQLLDRVIWAYGQKNNLRFTIFRPFNWIGPNLDDVDEPKEGSSRVVTQFLGHLLRGEPLCLVDGGRQRRCFTYIDDGIDALMKIIANPGGAADGRILNLGNPANDCSIRELAELMMDILTRHPGFEDLRQHAGIQEVSALDYYGPAYQDMATRVPDVTAARQCLGWAPRIGLAEALERTIAHHHARGEWHARSAARGFAT